jgi:alkanesulfonate monooxygenase SsuD/methylene tetrahydromethanopterin reductase-like flavin-dependent oxidoreductase (luciferase family)
MGSPDRTGRVTVFRTMRFGLDIAQQRMPWDELVRRVRLAEALGFDGAWGFDHFQPMYGEGPGETFEGMT